MIMDRSQYIILFFTISFQLLATGHSEQCTANCSSCLETDIWKYHITDDSFNNLDLPVKVIFQRVMSPPSETSSPKCDLTNILQHHDSILEKSQSLVIILTHLDTRGLVNSSPFLPFNTGFHTYPLSNVRALGVMGALLDDEEFCSLENLTSLSLEANAIKSLKSIGCGKESQCCKKLENLKLTQSGFKIGKLPPESFQNLKKLELRASLDAIEEDALKDLVSLKEFSILFATLLHPLPPTLLPESIETVTIEYTNINSIPTTFFKNLPNLNTLSLSKNRMEINETTHEIFSNLTNLKDFHLKNHFLETIPSNLLQHFVNLENLTLSENNLKFTTNENSDIFSSMPNLQHLDFTWNEIDNLPENLFRNIQNLKTLILETNKLSSLNNETFYFLKNLHTLSLRENNIHVPENTSPFSQLVNLKHLDFRKNKLEKLFNGVFDGLQNLEYLDLSFNNLQIIEPLVFEPLNNVQECRLNHNNLKQIGPEFYSLYFVKTLLLDFNNIETIDSNTLCNNQNLMFLDLRWNKIKSISYKTSNETEIGHFDCLKSLKEFRLSRNQLQTIDYAFLPSSLEKLDLSMNSLHNITDVTNVRNTFHMQHINLQNNHINQLTKESLCPSLESINLKGNRYVTINDYALANLTQLKELNFLGTQVHSISRYSLGSQAKEWKKFTNVHFKTAAKLIKDTISNPMQLYFLSKVLRRKSTEISTNSTCISIDAQIEEFSVEHYENKNEDLVCQKKKYTASYYCSHEPFDITTFRQLSLVNLKFKHHLSLDCGYQKIDNAQALLEELPLNTTVLYLDGADINSLSLNTFTRFSHLHTLYLNGSTITRFDDNAFAGLANLKKLHLQIDHIAQMSETELDHFPTLEILYLHSDSSIDVETLPRLASNETQNWIIKYVF